MKPSITKYNENDVIVRWNEYVESQIIHMAKHSKVPHSYVGGKLQKEMDCQKAEEYLKHCEYFMKEYGIDVEGERIKRCAEFGLDGDGNSIKENE